MTEEEKKIITREKHPGRVPQGHKFAALMKKEKKKYCIRKNSQPVKVQQPVQSTVQQPVQSTAHQPVQSAVQHPVQPTVQQSL